MSIRTSESYALVMDEDRNPLQRLPRVRRFQIMVMLSVMWSTIFCLAFSAWFWWGEIVLGHVAIALGILITGVTFQRAREQTGGERGPRTRGVTAR